MNHLGDTKDVDREAGEDRPLGQDRLGRLGRRRAVSREHSPAQRRASSDQHGARGVVDNLAGDGPEKERCDRPMAARADDDEVRTEAACVVNDRAGGPAPQRAAVDGSAGRSEALDDLPQRFVGRCRYRSIKLR
jgi:hypothetical protein